MEKKIKKTKKSTRTISPRARVVKTKGVRKPPLKKKTGARKPKSKLALTKLAENPIIRPSPRHEWQAWQTFNPGVVLLNSSVHFIYRAIGTDGLSRFGYARSSYGFSIDERLQDPVYEHRVTGDSFSAYSFASGGSFGGSEDPRIVRVSDEDTLYMTYTACDGGLRVGLTSISVEDFLNKRWKWKRVRLISPPGEVHKNWVLFPEKIRGKYAILTSITPGIAITYRMHLNFKKGEYLESRHAGGERNNCWDTSLRGAGAPPLKTKYGWLLFYHAIDKKDPGLYKVGALLLDLYDPTVVLHRSITPVLSPKEWYENEGFKSGIVYVTGAVIKDGVLIVYYGGADSYVNVAYANAEVFLKELSRGEVPRLTPARVRSKK